MKGLPRNICYAIQTRLIIYGSTIVNTKILKALLGSLVFTMQLYSTYLTANDAKHMIETRGT